jgi:hypothetical protein
MSLNRHEHALFAYMERHPEEHRHWQAKVAEATRSSPRAAPEIARNLERELWDYLVERCAQVSELRAVCGASPPRLSLFNLAEYLVRVWGPPPKPKRPADASGAK